MDDPNATVAPSPGAANSPNVNAGSDEHPEQIGPYLVQGILGKGGFGLVYLAQDVQLHRSVAIKVPRRERHLRQEDLDAYLAEARVLASLDHPNIVPVHHIGTTPDGLVYVVSKLIEGSDLAEKMRQARLSQHEATELIATVAAALHYAHRKGLVHRDIKPGNILVDASGTPYVADFGLALKAEDFGKGTGFAGTPAYMSPEQARGEGHRVDGRSDIFSLGVVYYELLAGRRPFQGATQAEMLELIISTECRPLRQVDDAIAKELERICFKALAKRASERYMTANDMADDLRHFLAHASPVGPSLHGVGSSPFAPPAGAEATVAPALTQDLSPIKIVPKGLRSFDAHDADFFLELLPGPRDRDGLPDSLRFWKARIEETDHEKTFAVGLICGPSGCGKSSLVKAGLLPRLSDDVIAIYFEATAEETETRLLNGLRKKCQSLPANLNLKDTLAALRRGQGIPDGKKVLIVLDQFEQWLHAKKDQEDTELVQALRQCDGGRVQCIVMVRDDFWMAVIRFMRELEIRLLEGQNSAAVDLFPVSHAEKVLAAFGRAFGVLPEISSDASGDQKRFFEQAVAGLAQEGKVICVRLALFAEMMKGKAWTPATLKEVGGTAGVGVTFLEETFSATTAPPEHRYHEKAARGVLKALLPEAGADIKGHMRSHAELLEASGCAGRPKDFDDLMRILDGKLRLLTPTDPEGKVGDETYTHVPAGGKYYQLTHDYLVPALRDWLTRKQKETRRGRAELLLADRAEIWNARPEDRQLPTLPQCLQIRWWTQKKHWTRPQRKMMSKASRYHGIRLAIVAGLLAVGLLGGLEIHSRMSEQENAAHAKELVNRLVDADTAKVPEIVRQIEPYRKWADPLLKKENEKAGSLGRQKLPTSLALLPVDPSQVDYIYEHLLSAGPSEIRIMLDALAPHKQDLLEKLWTIAEEPTAGQDAQRLRAACALAKYDPNSQRWAKVQDRVADHLVAVPAVYSSIWTNSLRDVGSKLQVPLASIFRNPRRRETERSLATEILAEYAADQPEFLADLLMDADENQFAAIFAKLKEHGERGLPVLTREIDKKQIIIKDKIVFEKDGTIADDDTKVKPSQGTAMPAKRFEVRLLEGKKYRLTMESKDLDSFLVLQDKRGKELAFDDDSGGEQDAMLVHIPVADDAYTVFAASLKGTGSFRLKIVETFPEDGDETNDMLAKRQANAAVALVRMHHPQPAWQLLKFNDDPRVRSYLIHRLGPLGADVTAIINRLNEEPDITTRRALILSLGEYKPKELPDDVRRTLLPKLKAIYAKDADPGLHGASEWLLRSWKHGAWLKQVNDDWAKEKRTRRERLAAIRELLAKEKQKSPLQWYVNGQGYTMVVIPGPVEFVMGSPPPEVGRQDVETQHNRRINRTFAVAAKAVTVEQYRKFDADYQLPAAYKRMADLPVVGTSWFEAAAYCNWLSEQEGIDPKQWCYETEPPGAKGPKAKIVKLKANYLQLEGYRLPTEAEMEYATRGGAVTARFFGESDELLPNYAWYQKNSKDKTQPVGLLKPNDYGFFDLVGNVYSWCQESYAAYPPGGCDDKEDSLKIDMTRRRVMRGGSFVDRASIMRSACRTYIVPEIHFNSTGFRVARTLPVD